MDSYTLIQLILIIGVTSFLMAAIAIFGGSDDD